MSARNESVTITAEEILKMKGDLGLSNRGLATHLGIPVGIIAGRLRRHRLKGKSIGSPTNIRLRSGLSETDFLKPFDWAQQLRDGIKQIVPGVFKCTHKSNIRSFFTTYANTVPISYRPTFHLPAP